MNRWMLFLILFLPGIPVNAGIVGYSNMAMTTNKNISAYSIPEFYSKREAEQWGSDMKGVEPIRRALKHRMESLVRAAHLDQEDALDVHRIQRAGHIMQQHEFLAVALKIIEEYKHYENNDKAMTTYTPYRIKPLKDAQDAIRLANKLKWNDDVMITIREVRSKLLELTVYNSSYSPEQEKQRVSRLMDQWEWLGLLLSTMQHFKDNGIKGEDPAQVGSSLYAYSMPMRFIHGN